MKSVHLWFIGFTGFVSSIQSSTAMDITHETDFSTYQSPPSSGRVYNVQPSRGSESYQWLTSQENFNPLKTFKAIALPESADFRSEIPYIHDQGKLGSCTAQAITMSMEYILSKTNPMAYRALSPLFVYYNERDIEGTIGRDAGAVISDGILSVCRQGACGENQWTYSDNRIKFKKRPPALAYQDAKLTMNLDNIGQSHVQQDLTALKTILAQGIPIVFGINVYSSFESKMVENTGAVPMPKRGERKLGGHAMTLVGYNDQERIFHFANSWGADWGNKGFGTISYDYIINPRLTDPDDFWKIESVGAKFTKKHDEDTMNMEIEESMDVELSESMEF